MNYTLSTVMLAAVLVGAVLTATCVRNETAAGVVTHLCPLCDETNAANVLAGDGVIWYIGGGGAVSECANQTTNAPTKTWRVADAADIQQDPSSTYILNGGLRLLGSDTTLTNTRTQKAIEIVGKTAVRNRITNAFVSDDIVAVRAYRGDPTGDLVNLSGLVVDLPVVPSGKHALAVAHCTNDPITVTCDPTANFVVSQPVVALTKVSTKNCIHTDLGDILNIYGRAYEVSFYNFNYKGESPLLESLVKWLAIVDAVLLIIIGTCHGSRASALRVKQD